MTDAPTICPRCGYKVPAGEECPNCASKNVLKLVHREFLLLLLLALIAIGAYFGTLAFASTIHETKVRLALSWYREGQQLLQASHADQAVAAFRKAAVNDRGNRVYTLALANALEKDGRDREALQLLLQLRDRAPEDPEINVELGRIAIRQNNIQDAIRYYHNALYGIWTGDEVDLRRTQVRRELIEFLLAQHATDQALAEIMALSAHLGNDAASHEELGALFLRAGDPARALAEFQSVLHDQPHNQAALQGAGQAAFETGDHVRARQFLSAVTQPDPNTKNMLEVATLVVENDPLAPRLAASEREHRLLADFDRVVRRVQDCQAKTSGAPLTPVEQKLVALRPSLTAARLKSDPNLPFAALELVYEAEETMARVCGQPQAADLALLLIAQKSRRAEQ